MKLNTQKRIAAQILKCSPSRVKFDTERLEDIKESITKADIKSLISSKAIKKIKAKGVSRARANKIKVQKSKGKRKGPGTRRGKATSRAPRKQTWMNRVRKQREFVKSLKEKKLIDSKIFNQLYSKIKGGFFRSERHIKIYITEHGLVKK